MSAQLIVPGTPSFNPAWYAKSDIWWDPQNGDDNASGDDGHAVKSMAEICKRYGTSNLTPSIVSNVTIHQLSDQTLNEDSYYCAPTLAPGIQFCIVAVNPPRGGNFSPTSVTVAVKTNAGTRLALNGPIPAGAAVGDIVRNLTKGSSAQVTSTVVDSIRVTQPHVDTGLFAPEAPQAFAGDNPVEDNTWASTDVYQLEVPLLSSCLSVGSVGGIIDPTATFGCTWLQGLHFPDSSGGSSIWGLFPVGGNAYCSLCLVDPVSEGNAVDADDAAFISCVFTNLVYLEGFASCIGGEALNDLEVNGPYNFIDNDFFASNILVTCGTVNVGNAGCNGIFQVKELACVILQPFNGGTNLWGSGTFDPRLGGYVTNESGHPYATILNMATLQIHGKATATKYAAGVFTDGIAVNAANIDANAGLQDVGSGSRFVV